MEITTHLLLTPGIDRGAALARVSRFFAGNFLVKYDQVEIAPARSIAGSDPDFWPRLERGLSENRRAVAELLQALQGSGFATLADLAQMPRGYESKLLHLLTHLLDGFFGIDSRFYNLEEDSHGISERLRATIRKTPGAFWLVEAECASASGHESSQLDLIRQLAVELPDSGG